jgi:hypothetical protein
MTDPIVSGTCYVLFAYDVGHWIRLDEAAGLVGGWTRGSGGDRPPPPGRYLDFKHPPLRAVAPAPPVSLGPTATVPEVQAVIFDFGAVALTYRIPLGGPLSGLVALSGALYENAELLAASREQVAALLGAITPAVDRPRVGRAVEDYAIFQIGALEGVARGRPDALVEAHRGTLAQVLRSETRPLSEQETADALASRIGYGREDLAIIDSAVRPTARSSSRG